MSNNLPLSEAGGAAGPERSLLDRVREQVEDADRRLVRRDFARQPRIRRRIGRPRSGPAPGTPARPRLTREVRALREVFTDLGEAHRRYRQRTGDHVSPGLRAAALAFKQAPSLGSLVPVAAFLDELALLEW